MKITTKFIASSAIVLGLIISSIGGSAFFIRRTEASFNASREKTQHSLNTVMEMKISLQYQVAALKDFMLLQSEAVAMQRYQKAMSNFSLSLDELALLMPANEEILVIRSRHKFLKRLASGLTDTPSGFLQVQQDVRSINSFKKDIELYLEDILKQLEDKDKVEMQEFKRNQVSYLIIYWVTIGIICAIAIAQYHLILKPTIRGIKNLQEGAAILGSGNLSYQLNLQTDDELEELAIQFNRMGQQLSELYFSLENKVSQRTAALSEANKYLQTEISDREQAQAELQQALKNLQKAQAQLVQTEKMSGLGQMVAGVAHEINNPVGFIYSNIEPAREYIKDIFGLLELYQEEYPQTTEEIESEIEAIDLEFIIEDLPNLLKSMEVGAERITDIVKSLRTFSRLHEAELKSINLHRSLESTLMILQNRLKSQVNRPEIKVIKDYGELPKVECYAGQLNQVLMHLLNNAIDAFEIQSTLSSPNISIRTWVSDPEHVSISIADNGCGMSEEIRQKIFDPFFTTKPVGKGTGLGLSTSYQIIVDKHGGELECVSTPGEGTEFIITIPIQIKLQKKEADGGETRAISFYSKDKVS